MKILIVEDHAVVATGLRMGLEAEGHEVTTTDGTVLAELDGDHDLVILDIGLGAAGSGLDLLPRFRDTVVVVLTGETDTEVLAAAFDLGAAAVLDKSVPFAKLLRHLDAAVEGNDTESEQRRHEILGKRRTEAAEQRRRLAPFADLTERESAVLAMLMEGRQAAEIADASYVSISTVRSQIRSVLSKLGVSSQLTAVAMAVRAGWTPDAKG